MLYVQKAGYKLRKGVAKMQKWLYNKFIIHFGIISPKGGIQFVS